MKKALFCLIGSALFVAAQPLAAETWKGTISDASCAAKHSAEKHGDASMKHEACVKKCVDGGAAYVFLTGDKVLKISNQDFADLKANAGKEVNLTGDLTGETVTIAKLESTAQKEKK
jgi:hypothetical protein